MSAKLQLDNVALQKMLLCSIGLRRQIVGVTLFSGREEYEECALKSFKTAMTYCSMVRMAGLGHGRKGTVAHVGCPGAHRALGLVPPNEEYLSGRRSFSLGMYRDIQVAQKLVSLVCRVEDTVYGIAVQPLVSCVTPPQVVISICDPNQAMRMVQGYAYVHGGAPEFRCHGMQGLCAELTARPFVESSLNISMLCSNTRYTCSWGSNELGVGLPYAQLNDVVSGVMATIDASESNETKQVISRRAAEMDLDVDVHFDAAYYLRPGILKKAAGNIASESS